MNFALTSCSDKRDYSGALSQALDDTLTRYVRLYNHQLPQKALGHIAIRANLSLISQICLRYYCSHSRPNTS